MGEVGGSFNERKNEITRKLKVCPTTNANSGEKRKTFFYIMIPFLI